MKQFLNMRVRTGSNRPMLNRSRRNDMRCLIAGFCLLSLTLLLGCATQTTQPLDQADSKKMGQKEKRQMV